MSVSTRIGVIINRNSRRNRERPDIGTQLEKQLGASGLVCPTSSLDELRAVVTEFCRAGIQYWVIDGGDGSLNCVINELVRQLGIEELATRMPYVVPTGGGTINFVARYARVRSELASLVASVLDVVRAAAPVEHIRVPTMVMRGVRGARGDRSEHFEELGFVVGLAGVSSGFFQKYYASQRTGSKAMLEVIVRGGFSLALAQRPFYRLAPKPWLAYGDVIRGRKRCRLWADGKELPFREVTVAHVGAFPIDLGGIIKTFRKAGDGELHAIAGDVSDFELLCNIPRLVRGGAVRADRLFDSRVTQLRASAEEHLFDLRVDGEHMAHVREVELTPGPVLAIPRLSSPGAA